MSSETTVTWKEWYMYLT